MNKRVGFLGLIAMAADALFAPATASAQERVEYRHAYGPVYRGPVYREPVYRAPVWHREGYRDYDFRIAREREIERQREWRDRRCERPYAPYYGYR